MLKFLNVINCIFVHWAKKITLVLETIRKSASNPRKKNWGRFLFFSFKCQKFTWKSEKFSVTHNFKVVHWYKNSIFYSIRFEIQPQVRNILRPTPQQPPLLEVKHNAVLPWISEKISPIVDSRPKVLISGNINENTYLMKWKLQKYNYCENEGA
jgi:hypothetical protein